VTDVIQIQENRKYKGFESAQAVLARPPDEGRLQVRYSVCR
jgi:hypothetical protein